MVLPAVLAAGLAAQEVTFRIGTRLAELSVTVLDGDGNPMAGLCAGDFTIEDEGRPRSVAFCHFDGGPPSPQPRAPLPAGVFTNMVEIVGDAPRNISAIVLDGLNTPPEHNARVRSHVMKYLKELPPETRIAVYHMGQRLSILHDFTDDAASLCEKVEKARLEMPLETITDYQQSVIEAEQLVDMFEDAPEVEEMARTQLNMEMASNAAARRSRMERSLAAMEALGKHLAGIPGRKSMIWVRHREGYFAEDSTAPQPDWNAASWRTAIASPLGSSAVRFVVACRPQPQGDLHFQIRVAAASLQFREAGEK